MLGHNFGGQGSLQPLDQDIKSLIQLMAKGGWEGLDALGAHQEKIETGGSSKPKFTSDDLLSEQYYNCFSTPAGQAVLTHLVECVLLTPPVTLMAGQPLEAFTAEAVADTAQKKLVWSMFNRMKIALELKNKPNGGSNAEIS